MIFQHGFPDDFWTAQELSKTAAEMGHERTHLLLGWRPSNGDDVESGIESAEVIGIGRDHAQAALAGEDDD